MLVVRTANLRGAARANKASTGPTRTAGSATAPPVPGAAAARAPQVLRARTRIVSVALRRALNRTVVRQIPHRLGTAGLAGGSPSVVRVEQVHASPGIVGRHRRAGVPRCSPLTRRGTGACCSPLDSAWTARGSRAAGGSRASSSVRTPTVVGPAGCQARRLVPEECRGVDTGGDPSRASVAERSGTTRGSRLHQVRVARRIPGVCADLGSVAPVDLHEVIAARESNVSGDRGRLEGVATGCPRGGSTVGVRAIQSIGLAHQGEITRAGGSTTGGSSTACNLRRISRRPPHPR